MPDQNDPYAAIAKPIAAPASSSDPYASLAGQTAPTQPPAPPTIGQTVLQGAKDFGSGLLKGAASTSSNLQKIPYIGAALTAPPMLTGQSREASQKQLSDFSQTHGTMQGLGKGVEQAGEFLIPGGAEEGLAAKAAEFAPKLAPLARIGGQALSSGLINKAQGGEFKTGALMGGGAGALGEGLRAAAPTLAEKAIGIRGKFDRSFNKAPGRALLDETKGISPEGVASQAKSKIGGLAGQVESLAGQSDQPASLLPARTVLSDASKQAAGRNAKGTYSQLQGMGDTLHSNFATGEQIPEQVAPSQLLNLRRGFDEEHLRWNPDIHEPASAAGRKAYGGLTGELHRVVPETAPLDSRISNLIPVARRAETTALNDNTGAKILGRFGAHTGALSGGIAGGYAGYQHGGAKDALLGGLAGVAVPELIASPQGQLAAARLFNHPGALTRPLTGAVLNIGRNMKSEDEQ